jgi:cytochrome c oxidase assembly protein Cox11
MIATTSTAVKQTQEVKISEKTKQQVIAVCCLTFFPLMYLVGKTLVSLLKELIQESPSNPSFFEAINNNIMIATTSTAVKQTQEVKISEKTKQQVIAVCCLTFFPLMYLVGKTLVSLL